MKEEANLDYAYSTKMGIALGFLAGWAIGVALLLYLDSPQFNSHPYIASIPLWNGFGWALFGFIVGGGGLFGNLGKPKAAKAEPLTELKTAA